jgi:hypothetical protein
MEFFIKKPLIACDPKTLSFDLLHQYSAGLVAKLIIVSEELRGRYECLANLCVDLPNTDRERRLFVESADKLADLMITLQAELARLLPNRPANSSNRGNPNTSQISN